MKTPPRKPTYGAATRLARIVLELVNRPFGWGFESIQRELNVSERTLLRYIAASKEELVDSNGRPLIEIVKHGSQRKLRLADLNPSPDSTAYHPEKHMDGMFGVFDGEPTKVRILLHNDETEAFLRARTIHASQAFERRADGKTVVSMTVRGTTELRNWVLSLGPWAEILEPTNLRSEIGDLLSEAATLYRTKSR